MSSTEQPGTLPAQTLLERLRAFELAQVRDLLPGAGRILEIGAACGFQAALMAAWGADVCAVDVALPPEGTRCPHPVTQYDGVHLPYADATFDCVFSSNVLEHVHDLPALNREIRRVLRPGGRAVHLLPTPTWRFWTLLTHYPFVVRALYQRLAGIEAPAAHPALALARSGPRASWAHVARRALWASAHGEYPGALSELWYFSGLRWRRTFRDHGFAILEERPSGLFYTGYSVLSELPLQRRAALARWLGSACRVYVLEPLR